MRRNYPRTQPLLVRSPDPLPRWVRLAAVWSAVAVALVLLSRAMTVAGIDDPGPPPMVVAQVAP